MSEPEYDALIEKILGYKKSINESVKEIIHLISQSNRVEKIPEIRKKIQDIIYSLSSIGTIEGKSYQKFNSIIGEFSSACEIALTDLNVTAELLVDALSTINGITIEIERKRPFKIHFDFEALRGKLSALIERK